MTAVIKLSVNGSVPYGTGTAQQVNIIRNGVLIGEALRLPRCGMYEYKGERMSRLKLMRKAHAIPVSEGETFEPLQRPFQVAGNIATFTDETGDTLTVNLNRKLIIINDGKKNRRSVLLTDDAWRGLRDMLKAKVQS